MQQIYPGVWKITLGEPEWDTPVHLRHTTPAAGSFSNLPPAPGDCPIAAEQVTSRQSKRGFQVTLPLALNEQVYGLGLQLLSFNQRRKKKTLRVNSDPRVDLGDSHAPVPFYVSTAGYGVLVDTARYATFYLSPAVPRQMPGEEQRFPKGRSFSPNETYDWTSQERNGPVIVEIPASKGVDLYLFGGPGMREAVQRYNLFSGGGCLPPRWGLGVWYRTFYQASQEQVLAAAEEMRQSEMPCDVIGLEPGWQSHAYSCSFTWNAAFPDPQRLIRRLGQEHYRVNLWTHVFTHPTSPIFEALYPYSGDYQVFGGLVPDLLLPETRAILGKQFSLEHVELGVSGYKLDECDNSDYNSVQWMFPEASQFPSGVDGEVMHSLLGVELQDLTESIFRQRNQRTYGDVRSSYALAAPYPFVLYSDLYDAKEFIRGLVNCGFSGLLWTPEVRDAASKEDLIRRMQAVILSPQAQVNAWYIRNPPWKQWRTSENNTGRFLEDWKDLQSACRSVLELRMKLLPYLYAAFYRYHMEGLPPFRALVMDYPADPQTYAIDDEFMIGDRLLAAPLTGAETRRKVYLPEGQWADFWTGQAFAGEMSHEVEAPLEVIPLFVKSGSLLPLARPTLHTEDPASYDLEVRVYGDGSLACSLFEDDGTSLGYERGEFNRVEIGWDLANQSGRLERSGTFSGANYRVTTWKRM